MGVERPLGERMYDRILIPTDGSDATAGAITYGIDMAQLFDADIHTLYVVDTREMTDRLREEHRETITSAAEKIGRHATEAIAKQGHELQIEVTRAIRHGAPSDIIIEYAKETASDVIIMGTHGRTGQERFFLGSTAERVVKTADIPVLTVRKGITEAGVLGHELYDDILVPTDGSDAAVRAAEQAIELAEQYGATVYLLYVVDTTVWELGDTPRSIVRILKEAGEESMANLAEQAAALDVPITQEIRKGIPYREICTQVDETDADLIVMGTRGRTGQPEVLLGSTTDRILRTADVPVLTVS